MIGERLKLLRTSMGISRKKLARAINTSVRHIANLENNKKCVTITTLIKLVKFFNTKANYLLGLD